MLKYPYPLSLWIKKLPKAKVMFTLHNKELLDVKRLKPGPFMINVLKSKQQGWLKKIFSNKKSFIMFAIFINNLFHNSFSSHRLLTGLRFTVSNQHTCTVCSAPTHALLYHTYIDQENYIWLLIMIRDNYIKLHVLSLREKCQSNWEFRHATVSSPAPS